MNDSTNQLQEIKTQFDLLKENLNLGSKNSQLNSLQKQSTDLDFWQNDQQAKLVMKQISDIQSEVDSITQFDSQITNLLELLEIADPNDKNTQKELSKETKKIIAQFNRLKISSCMTGKYDQGNAILTIHSGAGGTEAMDWAAMLSRMYERYFDKKDYKFEILEESLGEEAGIKSKTYLVKGRYAYGYLKSEVGTHRLVRQSPFNADNLRQTSFSGVEVLPSFEEHQEDIEVKDEDLDWQFYRSGGKGGQNVNKVSTAVRLTHKPTGLVVTCSSERSQEQNRKIALGILEAKLWQIEEENRQKTQDKIKGEHKVAGFGHQIRSYVLHPYHLVKDLRTEVETSNTSAVLDGDLDLFIQSFLLQDLN